MSETKFNPSEHLIRLKGKDYLEVKWRLVWFREEKPGWCIETQCIEADENHAMFAAKILDDNGLQKSSGYGSESKRDFADFIEKAETKAVGRALAMLGYGTQFAPELDEEDRIVDAPVERRQKPQAKKQPTAEQFANTVNNLDGLMCRDCGVQITKAEYGFSDKNYGKPLCRDCQKKNKKVS